MEGKLRRLQIEINALEREKDEAAKARLREAGREAANVEKELKQFREKYECEKEQCKEIQDAKIRLDQVKVKLADAEKTGDIATASGLVYSAIPELQVRIARLERRSNRQPRCTLARILVKFLSQLTPLGRNIFKRLSLAGLAL